MGFAMLLNTRNRTIEGMVEAGNDVVDLAIGLTGDWEDNRQEIRRMKGGFFDSFKNKWVLIGLALAVASVIGAWWLFFR
jgi:hypothetical protein